MIGARVTEMTNQKCELANVWIYDMLMWIQSLKMIGCDVMCQRMFKVGIMMAGARPNQWLELSKNCWVVLYKVCLPVLKVWWFGEWLLRLAPGIMICGGDDWRKDDSDMKSEMWIDRYVEILYNCVEIQFEDDQIRFEWSRHEWREMRRCVVQGLNNGWKWMRIWR